LKPSNCPECDGLNKRYAVKAVALLRNNPNRKFDENPALLWIDVLKALGMGKKAHNEQMHVVAALHKAKLINATSGDPACN
jgi:hypothetical protein